MQCGTSGSWLTCGLVLEEVTEDVLELLAVDVFEGKGLQVVAHEGLKRSRAANQVLHAAGVGVCATQVGQHSHNRLEPAAIDSCDEKVWTVQAAADRAQPRVTSGR